MKSFCSFKRAFFIFVLVFSFASVLSAQEPSEETDKALDEEIKWLQAEAEATLSIATKTEMTVQDAPSVVSLITEEQIKNSGAKSLEEVLRQAAGFYILRRIGSPDVFVSIRGFFGAANAGVKLMINGHSTENVVIQNQYWFDTFPLELIKKIEIIRGPGSALYGAAAMNGLINIITKDASAPSSVSAGYGSFDTYKGTGQLSYIKNDFSLFLFADTTRSNGDPQLIEKDAASASFPAGYSLAPGYTNEEFRQDTFFAGLSYKNFRMDGFFKDNRKENPVGVISALTDENNISDKTAYVKAEYELYDRKTTAYTQVFQDFPPGEGAVSNPEAKAQKIGGELTLNMKLPYKSDLVAGVLLEHEKGYDVRNSCNGNLISRKDSIVLDGLKYNPMQYLGAMRDVSESYNWMDVDRLERTVRAAYIQGMWNIAETFPSLKRIGKTLTLTAGLRYDDYDDVGSSVNPRAGIVYAPNDRLFFKLLYGEAFRAPGFNELYYKNNPSVTGNPDLKPETVKTAEALAGIHITDRITATVDFFRIQKNDMIRVLNGAFTNRGEIESHGIEGEIRASIDRHKYGYFNITYQKVEDKSHDRISDAGGAVYIQDDYDIGSYPEVMANLGINWDITDNIKANMSVNHIASVGRSDVMRFTPDKSDPDGTLEQTDKRDSISGYTLMDLSLTFGNFSFAEGWEFQITGYNLFDADQTDPVADGAVPNDFPRWGRHFLGKLTYTF